MNTNKSEQRKQNYARLAQQTLSICEQGAYQTPSGAWHDIASAIQASVTATQLYTEADLQSLTRALTNHNETKIEVWAMTTIAAARELLQQGEQNLLSLNFASAKNPGGGFLGGAEAQEENLAKASALYPGLITQMAHYQAGRAYSSCLYRHDMIYSPDVVFFRDDSYALLEQSFTMSVITSAAVNAGVIKRNEVKNVAQIIPVMRQRARYVLRLALAHGHSCIILGAWGCGVFQNDPQQVADIFMDLLTQEQEFNQQFKRVIFAVPLGKRDKNHEAFFNKVKDYVSKSKTALRS